MPAKKKGLSALKALRQSRKRHSRNRAVKTRIKTAVTSARAVMTTSETARIVASVKTAAQALDKAASKGVIHKNTAARRKSRLMRRLASKVPSAAPPQAEPPEPAQ